MKQIIPYILVTVLGVCLFFSLTNRKEVVVEKTYTDTVIVERIDTIKYSKPIYVSETILDTIFIKPDSDTTIFWYRTQRVYKDSTYIAWVSGINPHLDSLDVYSKTRYVTVTNTIERQTDKNTTDIFGTAGAFMIGKNPAPYIGTKIKLKNGFMVGGNVGYYDRNVMYGVELSLKF